MENDFVSESAKGRALYLQEKLERLRPFPASLLPMKKIELWTAKLVMERPETAAADALALIGCFVRIAAFHPNNQENVRRIHGYAFVDTGSDRTILSTDIAEELGLPLFDSEMKELTPKIAPTPESPTVKLCRWNLSIPEIELQSTIEGALSKTVRQILPPHMNCIAVIGRDLLRQCILVYDGSTGVVTLEAVNKEGAEAPSD